jgi:DNA invertase Pin-like site-specific DNA recombinase
MTNAAAYIRVSTDSQADSGAGLAAQRAAIEVFAKRAGITITSWHEDAGVSGAAGIEARPGLAAAIASLRKGDTLIVAKRDRVARDTFLSAVIERAVTRKGAAIVSADGVGNGNDAADAFMRQVMSAAAEFERGLIRQRTKAAMAAKRKAGERCGQVPFGWCLGEDGSTLVPVAEEQRVIEQIVRCREAGMSYRAIAAILTEEGIAPKGGSGSWVHTSVKSILDRQAALAA